MSKTIDVFTKFYKILKNIITNSKYNVNTKIGLLKIIPKKLKLFNMVIKSYSQK